MHNKLKSKALLELEETTSILVNPALQKWKNRGGKIIGCMYHYIPEEIITAAGMLPYRMRPINSTGCELSESCFTQVNCTFVRHLFDSGMRGDQTFLDGVVTANNCDHIRRLYDNWKSRIKTPYMHFLSFPKKSGKEQVEAYRKELVAFKKSLEDYFKVDITKERMREAISLHNETRRLQRELYDLRKSPTPPMSGAEILAIMIAGTAMPRERYNALLSQVLKDCAGAKGYTDHRVRVMLVGGEVDSIGFVEAIESQGGLVVADSLGYGSRTIQRDVNQRDDPLTACARYQLMERPADPRIFGTSLQRNNYVKNIAQEYNVKGIISFRLLQCDYWGLEQVNLTKYLKKNNLPHLALENEYILGSIGQIKTRVQAFFESIGGA